MPKTDIFVLSLRDEYDTVANIPNISPCRKPDSGAVTIDALPRGDDEICERLRQGDQAALRMLMDRHAPMILRLATNVLSDRGDAEDVVQEVFITVWKSRASWIGGGAKFSTWLHRVAINKAIDKRRSRRSRPEPAEYITAICDAAAAQDGSCDQSTQLDNMDISRKLMAEIGHLPTAQARALIYFYFEGRDVPAIASLMQASEQAVRSLLKRGRQALRTRLMKQKMTSSNDPFAIREPDHAVRGGGR